MDFRRFFHFINHFNAPVLPIRAIIPFASDKINHLIFIVCTCVIFALGIAARLDVAANHRVPSGDEGPWLRLATTVAHGPFMSSRVVEHDLYPERKMPHPEDNRSPLYPILIAIFRPVAGDYFAAGQLLNLFAYVAIFLLVGWIAWRHVGAFAALSALTFFSVSPFFITLGAQVYPDIIVAACFLAFFVYHKKFLQSMRAAVVGGIFFGLIFLLKTTAVFLLPVLALYYWQIRREEKVLMRLCVFALAALAVSMPWLIRNILFFGSPLHQVTKYHMYLERFADIFVVGMKVPTLGAYIKQHGFVHMLVIRPIIGFGEFLRAGPEFDNNLCLAALPGAVLGAFALRKKTSWWRMIMLFSVFYIPFMSYVNYAGWAFRYMMIYYILIYCLAAAGIQAIVEKIGHRLWKPFAWIAATVITFSVVVLPMEYHLSERWGSREQDRSIRRALPEMESLIPENQAVLSPFLSQYSFLHDINVVNATLQFPDCASLHSIFKSYTVRFALFYGSHKGLPMLDQCCVLEEIWQKDGMILYSVSIR